MEEKKLDPFENDTIDNPESIEEVLSETNAIIDTKLISLIEEAEKGNFFAMSKAFDAFAYGFEGGTPNYKLAMRYCERLNKIAKDSGEKLLISIGLNNLAYVYHLFGMDDEAHEAFLKAFRYMVANLEPENWDTQIVELVTEYVITHAEEQED